MRAVKLILLFFGVSIIAYGLLSWLILRESGFPVQTFIFGALFTLGSVGLDMRNNLVSNKTNNTRNIFAKREENMDTV